MEIFKFGVDISQEFSQDDIRNIRVQIVNNLLFCKQNKADISVVKNFYSPGHFSRTSRLKICSHHTRIMSYAKSLTIKKCMPLKSLEKT
uniref:Uncharacterized protein n=1 Tax=Arundo donax TaxID=35708 RepID=A0A0A8ZRH0_ARUDO